MNEEEVMWKTLGITAIIIIIISLILIILK